MEWPSQSPEPEPRKPGYKTGALGIGEPRADDQGTGRLVGKGPLEDNGAAGGPEAR